MTKEARIRRKREVRAGRAETKKLETKTERRAYRRPQIEEVPLVPEEAGQTACKVPGTAGPGVGACNIQGGPGKCLDLIS